MSRALRAALVGVALLGGVLLARHALAQNFPTIGSPGGAAGAGTGTNGVAPGQSTAVRTNGAVYVVDVVGTLTNNVTAANLSTTSGGAFNGNGAGLTNVTANALIATNISTLIATNCYLNLASSTNLPWTGVTGTPARSVGITIDGGGSAITNGTKGFVEVPYTCTIVSSTLLADQTGSIAVQAWRTNNASYPPTLAGVLGTNVLNGAASSVDAAPSNWTSTNITAGDILGFNVTTNAASCTRITFQIKLQP